MLNYILFCLLSVVICYFAGGIMFGVIVSKLTAHDDIRNHGSGNAGATNMLRVLGLKAGVITFLFDMIKCFLSMVLCKYFIILPASQGLELNVFLQPQTVLYYCGFAALIGHSFPVLFKFKGGKAVAGSLGVLLCLDWQIALSVLLVFVIVVLFTKTVSLGSILGAIQFILANYFVSDGLASMPRLYINLWGLIIGGLVIIRHKENIGRLLKGEEKPISFKSKK